MKSTRSVEALAFGIAICFAAGAQVEQDQERADQTLRSGASAVGQLCSVEKLIGTNVTDTAGDELGEIDNLIFDQDQNRITYVVMSTGEILGLGGKNVLVPWSAFTFTPDGGAMLDISKERMKTAPIFDSLEADVFSTPEYHESAFRFYEATPYRAVRGQDTDSIALDKDVDWDAWTRRDGSKHWARMAADVTKTNVNNADGDKIGEIEDTIIEERQGRAAYAMVSFGGVLGFFSDTAAVPWSALERNVEDGTYSLNTTKEALEAAKLDEDEYERLEDEPFSRSLHAAFEREPYWVVHGYVSPDEKQMKERGEAQTQSDKAQSEQKQSEQMTVSGTIVSVSTVQDAATLSTEQGIVQVRVRSADDGKERDVHLAMKLRIDALDIKLAEGDRIDVVGYETLYADRAVLQATSFTVNGKSYDVRMQNTPTGDRKPIVVPGSNI